MKNPVLSVRNLCVTFVRDGIAQKVVDGISFDIREGEIVGLVGESGCGKSVTAMALMGLLPPGVTKITSHSIKLAGEELNTLGPKAWEKVRGRRVSMIFQEPATALDPVFTIGGQISRVIRRVRRCNRSQAWDKALSALEDGGFPDPEQVARAYPHQLSGGMRQLAMIAMAVATEPELLIADEPTTALDVTTQSLIMDRMKWLQRSLGTSILLVTHDMGVIAHTCSRAMVMYCGRLVEQAAYAELFRHARHPYTAGLLASIPRIMHGIPGPVRAIPGRVPAPSELSTGCHFADRCSRCDALCRTRFPAMLAQGDSVVACYHPL